MRSIGLGYGHRNFAASSPKESTVEKTKENLTEAKDELRRVGQEITEHFHKVSRFGEPDLADAEWDNWCEELDKLVCKLVGIILATSTFIEEVKHEHRTALVLGYYNGRSRYNPKLWIGG